MSTALFQNKGFKNTKRFHHSGFDTQGFTLASKLLWWTIPYTKQRKETTVMDGTTLTQTQFALLSASVLQCLPEGVTLEVADSWRGNHEELRARLAFLGTLAPTPKKRQGKKGAVRLPRSCRFNPGTFIGSGWSIKEEDARTTALETIDLSKLRLKTVLRGGETQVRGEEKVARLRAEGTRCLGADHFLYFWENKNKIPEEWKKVAAVYFDGTILESPRGNRYVLYLCWRGDEWHWNYYWLESVWLACNPSAVSAE